MSEETKQTESTALAKRPMEMGDNGIVLSNLDDLWRFSQYVIASGMAPKGYDKPEKVIIAIQRGAEIGLKPLQALESIAVINGRATVWGDAIPGLLLGSGLLEDIQEYCETTGNDTIAVCRLKRHGVATSIEATFSISDAKTAGLWGKAGPWTQYPKRMLKMRARSWAARDGFADVLRGLHVREEVQDYTPHAPQTRQTVTLTADGRLESEPLATLPAPSEDADEAIDATVEPLVNGKGELF